MEKSLRHWFAKSDWWTVIFSGVVALTAVVALWYAHAQIEEARAISSTQLRQGREDAQIAHLLELVNKFDEDPMATYRKTLATKRLYAKDDDPLELYRILDFFETVGRLVDREYLNEEDVWNQFGYWILNLNADSDMKKNVEYEQRHDPNEYAEYLSLVNRLQRIDKEHGGHLSNLSRDSVTQFYLEESAIVGGNPVTRSSKPLLHSDGSIPTDNKSGSQPLGRATDSSQQASNQEISAQQTPTIFNPEPSNGTDRTNEEATTDRLLMIFTGVLALVATFQFIIFIWQIVTTQRTAEKQLRAYMFPSSVSRIIENGVMKIRVVFENSGKTPARRCVSWVFEGIADTTSPPFPKTPPKDTHSRYFVGPGSILHVYDDALAVSTADSQMIKNGSRFFYVSGEISYLDAFDKKQTTQFRFSSNGADFEAGRFTFCDEGNEAT